MSKIRIFVIKEGLRSIKEEYREVEDFIEVTPKILLEAGYVRESDVCKPYCDDCFKNLLEVDRGIILCGPCWAARNVPCPPGFVEKQKLQDLIDNSKDGYKVNVSDIQDLIGDKID